MSSKKWLHNNFFVGLYLMLTKGRQDLIVLKEGAEIVEGGLVKEVKAWDAPMRVGYGRWIKADSVYLQKKFNPHIAPILMFFAIIYGTGIFVLALHNNIPSVTLWLMDTMQPLQDFINKGILSFYIDRVAGELIERGYPERAQLFALMVMIAVLNLGVFVVYECYRAPQVCAEIVNDMKKILATSFMIEKTSIRLIATYATFKLLIICTLASLLISILLLYKIEADYNVEYFVWSRFRMKLPLHTSDTAMYAFVTLSQGFIVFVVAGIVRIKAVISVFLSEYAIVTDLVARGYLKWRA